MRTKWKRVAPGHYQTTDGAFNIRHVTSQQTGRKTEHVWSITTRSGNPIGICQETLRDAKQVIARAVMGPSHG